MTARRIVRYLLTFDVDYDQLVWAQYRDGSVQRTELAFVDVEESETEVLDLTGRTF